MKFLLNRDPAARAQPGLMGRVAMMLAVAVVPAAAGDNSLNLDNVIGLTVDVADSENCGGSTPEAQTVTNHASISGGGDVCPAKIAITVTGSVETQDAPYDYVYVNDVLFFSGEDLDGECAMTTKTVTKTVTVDPRDGITLTYATSDGLYHAGAYATITHAEVIEEGCESGCVAGGGAVSNGSIHIGLNLGNAEFGQSVGALRILEPVPSAILGTPSSLRYSSAWAGVQVIRDVANAIRQVKAPQCLADVVTETADRFRIDFYHPDQIGPFSGGLYNQAGKTAYVSWTIDNIDTAANGHLKITETRGAASVESEYIWDAVDLGWELVTGNGQRKEKKTTVINTVNQTRTVTTVVRNALDQLVSKTVDTYKEFAWGRELIQTVLDPDGAALTSSRTYYDNPVADGASYRRLKSQVQFDGGWSKHEYDSDGRPSKIVEPFLDSSPSSAESLCKVTSLSYQDTAPQETKVVTVLGQEIERSYKRNDSDFNQTTEEIVVTAVGAAYDDPTNLVTTRVLVNQGEFTGEVQSIAYPDGTGEIYQYSKTALEKTTILEQGELAGGSIVAGTRITTVNDLAGNLLAQTTEDIESGLTLSVKTVTSQDVSGRATVIDYHDGTTESFSYGCCGVESSTDREGITTIYTYDVFKRLQTESRSGITTTRTYDADGRLLTRKRIGSDSSEIPVETLAYDPAGRLVSTTDALNHTTEYERAIDGLGRPVETTIHADGASQTSVFHRDGRTFTTSGNAVAPKKWLYGIDSGVGTFTQEISIGGGGSETEWFKVWKDPAGRTVRHQVAGRSPSVFGYNPLGRMVRSQNPDGVVRLLSYDGLGRVDSQTLDLNLNDLSDAADQIERFDRVVITEHGEVVQREESRVVNDVGVEEVANRMDISLDGKRQWTERWGLATTSVTTYGPAGSRTTLITHPDGSSSELAYSQGRLMEQTHAVAGGGTVTKNTTYAYDAHGRLQSETDARNGTTSYTYDDEDRLVSRTTPLPGTGAIAQVTINTYDERGRVTAVTLPDNSEAFRDYYPNGRIQRVSGSQTPEIDYTYTPQGRIETMTTHGQAGSAVTTWMYEADSGWLQEKSYPDGNSLAYTYTDAGLLKTRVSDRGITKTYLYDDGGRQTGIDYSDSTVDISYTVNRLGQIVGITDASGSRTRVVSADGRLISETYDSGPLAGASLTNGYDAFLRRDEFSAASGGTTFGTSYSYDGASRLQQVTAGTDSATYAYLPDSSLLSSTVTSRAGTPTLTVTSEIDFLERYWSITSSNAAGVVSSQTSWNNSLNQRVNTMHEDFTRWDFAYDAIGQVIIGKMRGADADPVAGAQFEYGFDGIGNRVSTLVNGRSAAYAANGANQYIQREIPGFLDISGIADENATVTVNLQRAARHGTAFYKALPVDNSVNPQYPEISILAVLNDAAPDGKDLQGSRLGNLFLAKNPELFSYDEEGNLSSDGRWQYTWDAEGRLLAQESLAGAPVTSRRKLQYLYDGMGRRIAKQDYLWDGGAWALASDKRFLYDGWNLVAELDASNQIQRTYLWGLDSSGTLQDAGGIGGLLAVRDPAESFYPAFDGNGNVMALVKASDGVVAARYRYGPFGEPLVVQESGVSNPFRFSTKYQDSETGMYYYGYRYYHPATGRWLNKDLIEELGGANLYAAAGNDLVNWRDPLGLAFKKHQEEGTVADGLKRPNAQLYAGWYGSTSVPTPSEKGNNEVVVECDPTTKKYKVYIKTSKEIDVEVWSYVGTDQVGKIYTSAGLQAIKDHEGRRVEAYEKAYNKYLKVFEGEITGKCSKSDLNKLQANNYKARLEDWLSDKQSSAKGKFGTWTLDQQGKITQENSRISRVGNDPAGLIDGINNPHQVGDPPELDMTCPK